MSSEQASFYQQKLAFETDAWDLSRALQNANSQVIVVDARSAEAFTAERIPGAINIPHRTMSESTLQTLDREPLHVTYCDGVGCNASTKAALNMLQYGFRVQELLGGLDWWRRDGYATEGRHAAAAATADCGC